MLDAIYPWGGKVRPFRSKSILTRPARDAWEHAGYWQLRRQVFCDEQALFEHSDRDSHDAWAIAIVALSHSSGMPDSVVGVVRVYPAGSGLWVGGRLAVSALYRRHGVVGEGLIRSAVGTALARGCTRFVATVQTANVRYFERHHFHVVGQSVVCQRPHALMAADLARFQPAPNAERQVAA